MIKKIIYIFFFAAFVLLGVLVAGGVFFFKSVRNSNNKKYSIAESKNKYDQNDDKITEVIDSFEIETPENTQLEIVFQNNNTLKIFSLKKVDLIEGIYEENLKIDSSKTDSLLSLIGWNRATLKALKSKLDAEHCIGIKLGDSINVKFKRCEHEAL